jgi:hypothetical protein
MAASAVSLMAAGMVKLMAAGVVGFNGRDNS